MIYPNETIYNVLQRVKNGEKVVAISRDLNISSTCINFWRRDYNNKTLEEIKALRAQKLKNMKNHAKRKERIIITKGQKIGKLTAIEFVRKQYKEFLWKFLCDCGKIKITRSVNLNKGYTKSCGCYKNKKARELGRIKPGLAGFNQLKTRYKYGAKIREIPWNLTNKQLHKLFKSNCYYCGIEPSQKSEIGRSTFIYNGIDRLDNNKDYIKNNCVSCCKRCNFAKGESSVIEFKKWIKQLIEWNKNDFT